jgi:hypothetical protein
MSGDLNCPMAAKVASIFTPKPQVWRKPPQTQRSRGGSLPGGEAPTEEARGYDRGGVVAAVPRARAIGRNLAQHVPKKTPGFEAWGW